MAYCSQAKRKGHRGCSGRRARDEAPSNQTGAAGCDLTNRYGMIIEPSKHMTCKPTDAVMADPPLIGIDHGASTARAAAVNANCEEICVQSRSPRTKAPSAAYRGRQSHRRDTSEALKFWPCENTVHVIGRYHNPIRAQHKSMVKVGLRFSLACNFEIGPSVLRGRK